MLQQRHLNLAVKAGLSLLLLWSLYHQVFGREEFNDLWRVFSSHWSGDQVGWILAVLLLMPVNWALEGLKWHFLIRGFSSLSWWQTCQAVLCGLTISLFTPNRIGEYAGRILLVEPQHNWKAVVATLVSSYSQLLVLLLGGVWGLLFFANNFLDWGFYLLESFFLISLSLVLILFVGFVNIDLVVPLLRRIPIPEKWRKHLRHADILKQYRRKDLLIVLGLSTLRYFIYSLQYFFVLQFVGIQVPLPAAFSGIATIFFIQTSVPLPPLMGLLARGEIALFVWSFFGANELSILAATYGLFIINLSLPSLLGLWFIVKTNVIKSLGYGNKMV